MPADASTALTLSTLAIGDEVLWGDVVNTNAAWLADAVADLGAELYEHKSIGDTPAHIVQAVNQALQHCDMLIITGGLGPTDDDLTLKSLADGFGVDMIEDSTALATIAKRFRDLGKLMPPQNCKQALMPYGAESIANPTGTAPGMWWFFRGHKKVVVALPGVPREMKAMWPSLVKRIVAWAQNYERSLMPRFTRDIWFYGIGESNLTQVMGDRMHSVDPFVAPYVSNDGRVRLRLTCLVSDEQFAADRFDDFEATLPESLAPFTFEAGFETLPPILFAYLEKHTLKLATAESCTGGALSHAFINESGASEFIDANIVTYSNTAKVDLLSVDAELIERHGAVSEQVACAMAIGARMLSDDPDRCIGLSTTGIAGPSGETDGKPVGTLWTAIALPNGVVTAQHVQVSPLFDRASMQERFVNTACLHALQHLRNYKAVSDSPVSDPLDMPAQL